MERDEIEPRRLFARVHAGAFELLPQRAHAGPRIRDARGEVCELGVGVDKGQVGQWVEQRLVLMLPVQLHQPRRQIAQRGRRGERAVDEGPASSLAGELAADDDLGAAMFEDRFNRRVRLAGAHEVGGGAAAEQQPHGFHHD